MSGGSPAPARPTPNATLILVALLSVDGLHFVFARALRDLLDPGVSTVYILGIAGAQLTVYSLLTGRLRWQTLWRSRWFFGAVGVLVAGSTLINYTAVSFIDPGTAALLAQTSILFSLAFGLLWLGERLTRLQWVGAAIAIGGVAIITFQEADYLRAGSLLVLTSSFLYSLHTAVVKRYRGDMDFVEFFVWRLLTTFAILLAAAAGRGILVWPDARTWLVLLLVGTVDIVFSRSMYYAAVNRLDVSLLSLILTLSPVVAILWSLVLFQASPAPRELLGGAAVLAGVVLVTRRRNG